MATALEEHVYPEVAPPPLTPVRPAPIKTPPRNSTSPQSIDYGTASVRDLRGVKPVCFQRLLRRVKAGFLVRPETPGHNVRFARHPTGTAADGG